ncbi:TonB-dependent receptor domain-containing protein [Psychrobacter sp. I-STPA10]|uniref:TonB-dependent receptor domain-containing protein n=1 Tax=Psychrobacter sp. I-STPA10 TaxID=2585769 RepID=UPI001E5E6B5D|nr:TonB-dependent receptor [Psychrobacter sp. I-STPA10]
MRNFNASSAIPSRLSILTISMAVVSFSQLAQAENMPYTTVQTITVTANQSINERAQTDAIYVDEYTPAQQAAHLSDFLEVVPNVSVGGTSAVNQRVQIRGLDDTNLKVTVDGARQEGYLFHHMGNLVIDPELLKEAEVSVGNNSVTLGNDALGGGVAFKTVDAVDLLKPNQKIGAKAKVGYGSNNNERLASAAVYAMPTTNIDLLAYYSKRSADAGKDGDGREIQTQDSNTESILVKGGAYLTPEHHVSASFGRTQNKGDYPIRPDFPMTAADGFNPVVPQEMNRDTYTLGYRYTPYNPLLNLEANAYQSETQILRNEGAFDAKVTTKGGKVQNTSRIGDKDSSIGEHRFIVGAEHYTKTSDYQGTDRRTKAPVGGSDEATNTSVYIEDQWQSGKFSLTPGIRYDNYKAPKDVADGKTYNHVVGALAASYEIMPNSYLFASYTQLFNGPNLNEVIRNRGGDDTYITKDLKPETGDNKEIGFTASLPNINTSGDNLRLSAKYFITNLKDMIESTSGLDCQTGQPIKDGKCRGSINSSEEFDIKGGEISADYRGDNYSVGLSYARARSKGAETGYNLARDTGDKYMVNATYQPTDEWQLGWRSTFVSSLTPNTDGNDPKKPAYNTHDVYMSYQPQAIAGLTANLGVYNLFDETYASHASRTLGDRETPERGKYSLTDYEMGRNVKASLSYQF